MSIIYSAPCQSLLYELAVICSDLFLCRRHHLDTGMNVIQMSEWDWAFPAQLLPGIVALAALANVCIPDQSGGEHQLTGHDLIVCLENSVQVPSSLRLTM